MNASSPKDVRAIEDDYNRRSVNAVLERYGVSPTYFVPYQNFFREINARATRTMDKSAQKVRVDEIKAKYAAQGLKLEILNEISKLVPLKVSFLD